MLMIFGGEQYYATGGAGDFLCMAEESKAQVIAKGLLGTEIEYREEWDTDGDCLIHEIIEWVHVTTQEGVILYAFGKAFGGGNGKKTVKYLENK